MMLSFLLFITTNIASTILTLVLTIQPNQTPYHHLNMSSAGSTASYHPQVVPHLPIKISQTQKAVMFDANNGPIIVHQSWPVKQPNDLKPGEVLVRILYSGVCHTDLHAYKGDWPMANKLPLVGGHEGAGFVVAIAHDTETSLKIGDAVGVKWLADSCLARRCEECQRGYESSCSEAKNHGFTVDGSFQQYVVSYAQHCTPIPHSLSMELAAPILCAGVTVFAALKAIGGRKGETVVIPGAGGGLGHLCVQYALAMDYKVLAIDSGENKRALLASYGVQGDAFIDYKNEDTVEKIKALTGGRGAHAAVVVASSGGAYQQALEYLRPHGVLVAVGMPGDAVLSLPVFRTVVMSHRVVGSYVGNRAESIEALALAAQGKVHTTLTVEPLENVASVFERMEAFKLQGRVVLDCQ